MKIKLKQFIGFLWRKFRLYFGGGLVIIIPLLVTVYIIVFLVKQIDKFFIILLPEQLEYIVKFPGFGILATLVIVTLTGFIMRNRIGKRVQKIFESIVEKVPLARTIYQSVKQFLEAFVEEKRDKFKRAVIVEYPRKGVYTLGFVTNENPTLKKGEKKMVSIFIPTTPNPTSGFFILAPDDELIDVDSGIEDVFRLIISAGIADLKEQVDKK